MDWVLVLGALGLVVLLIAFVIEHLKRERFYFDLLNLIGSLILGVYAVLIKNIIFIILEFLWAVFSLFYLLRKD